MSAGSLRHLILTGLPKLQHLKILQRQPRTYAAAFASCKAVCLPSSLLSFDLTVVDPVLCIEGQLYLLARLPELRSVGLHGPELGRVPVGLNGLGRVPMLPTTVTRCSPMGTAAFLACNPDSSCCSCQPCCQRLVRIVQ